MCSHYKFHLLAAEEGMSPGRIVFAVSGTLAEDINEAEIEGLNSTDPKSIQEQLY